MERIFKLLQLIIVLFCTPHLLLTQKHGSLDLCPPPPTVLSLLHDQGQAGLIPELQLSRFLFLWKSIQ